MIESYNELPVGKYLEIQEIIKEDMSDIDKQVAIIAVLTDLTENEVLNIPITEYKGYAEKSMFLDRHMDVPKQVASVYEIGDWKLIPTTDIRKMTTAQYIDFQTFIKEKEKYLKNICACFLLPVGKKYGEGYKISKVVEDIGNSFSIVDAHSIFFFFTLLFQSLTVATLRCLEKKMKRGMKKMTKAEREMTEKAIMAVRETMSLLKNGAGLFG